MLNRQITTVFKVKNKPTSITPDPVKSSGQAMRALPSLEGIQPRKVGSPFGVFPPNPALASKTCR
jgi:hypothetical protein